MPEPYMKPLGFYNLEGKGKGSDWPRGKQLDGIIFSLPRHPIHSIPPQLCNSNRHRSMYLRVKLPFPNATNPPLSHNWYIDIAVNPKWLQVSDYGVQSGALSSSWVHALSNGNRSRSAAYLMPVIKSP